MANAIASATARPSSAPSQRRFPCTGVAACRELAKMIANVKTIVSRPSRPTAWNAMTPRPTRDPLDNATSLRSRSSLAIVRACWCIQNVI